MDIRSLKTFLSAAELLNFTSAAKVNGYSQSTVSFQIKQLETELGVRLFEHSGRGLVLSAEGKTVQNYATQMVRLSQDLADELHDPKEIKGTVRLVMANSLLPEFLSEGFRALRRDHPGISLKITAGGTEQMFSMLKKNEADLVYTLDNHIFDAEYKTCFEKSLSTHFVTGKGNPLTAREALSITDILDQPFYLTEKKMSYRKLLDDTLAARSLEIQPVLEIGSTEDICTLVMQDNAIAFLPDFVTEKYVKSGDLVRLSLADFDVTIWKQLIYRSDKWVFPAMQCVIDYCFGSMMNN